MTIFFLGEFFALGTAASTKRNSRRAVQDFPLLGRELIEFVEGEVTLREFRAGAVPYLVELHYEELYRKFIIMKIPYNL